MPFSKQWESVYSQQEHLSTWPWSKVVSLFHRFAPKPVGPEYQVLELGCGAGANIPFFESLGVDYKAVEGSRHVVDKLHQRYPHLKDRIVVGDFTQSIPFEGQFDLILDRGSLIANPLNEISQTLRSCAQRLKPHGLYLGTDWFSTECDASGQGKPVDGNEATRTDIEEGPLSKIGTVHFFHEEELRKVLSPLKIKFIEKQATTEELEGGRRRLTTVWNFVLQKPAQALSV